MRLIFITIALLCSLISIAQKDSVKAKVYGWNDILVDKDSNSYRMQFVNGPTKSLANLEIHLTELDPGKSLLPHSYSDAEQLVVVKEGILKVTIKGKPTPIGPGGVALVTPGDDVSFENTGKVLATYYVLKFRSGGATNPDRAKVAGGSFIGDWENWSVQENDKGERREVFDRFTNLFSKMELHVTTLNGGQVAHNPHKHPQEEILLVRKGNGQVLIGDGISPIVPGDVVFFASGVLHSIKNTSSAPLEYFALQWQ